MKSALEITKNYLGRLKADLEVEVDLHGGRTVMAYNLRTLILKTEKEIELMESWRKSGV
jgi:hypothetical protein